MRGGAIEKEHTPHTRTQVKRTRENGKGEGGLGALVCVSGEVLSPTSVCAVRRVVKTACGERKKEPEDGRPEGLMILSVLVAFRDLKS